MQSNRAIGRAALAVGFLLGCATYDDVSNPPKSSAGGEHPIGTGGSGGAAANATIEGGSLGSAMGGGTSGSAAGGDSAPPVGAVAGGTSGSGGSGLVSVTPPSLCGAPRAGSATDKLIDDMEDGDGKLSPVGGRGGDWFTYHDPSAGMQSPAQGAAVVPEASDRPDSTKAMHTTGSGFSEWGAGLGIALNLSCPYDGSAYAGIAFFAKGAGSLTLKVKTAATAPLTEGGSCATNCYDHFKKEIALASTWSRYSILWADLAQGGWGTPATFSPTALIGINFEIVTDKGTPVSFDFWIDDLTFQ